MQYHQYPSQNHHYKTLKKSNFYFQSLKTDTEKQHKQNEFLTNLRTVIKQNEILLSENNENNENNLIKKKKVRSQKIKCECSIF